MRNAPALAAAVWACSPDTKKTLAPADLAASVAVPAIFRIGAGLAPRTLAGMASFKFVYLNFGFHPKDCIRKVDG